MPARPAYLSPAAEGVAKPGMTPCQLSLALNQQQFSVDAVRALAFGLPLALALKWAAMSANKVANPAHVADFAAITAAMAFTVSPTPANLALAAAAAAASGHLTPGAWAAQAVAFSAVGGGLAAHAVAGAVLLAAALGGGIVALPPPPPPPGAPAIAVVVPLVPVIAVPVIPKPALPVIPVPVLPVLALPVLPKPGLDGLLLTPPQRIEMAANCDLFLKLGCDIGHGRA